MSEDDYYFASVGYDQEGSVVRIEKGKLEG